MAVVESMDEHIFTEDVDCNFGVESDLHKILQSLAGEDPCCQLSSTITRSNHPEFDSPKIDYFDQSRSLSSSMAKYEPYCFASQILPKEPDAHLASISSSLLALELELLDPFTPDLSTTSSTTADIQTSDNLKQRMRELLLDLSREEAAVEEIGDAVASSRDDRQVVFGSNRKVAGIKVAADKRLAPINKSSKRRATHARSNQVVPPQDGYKWIKYGEKVLKNNSHPRNYYRCSFNKCSVKKTVERSCKDSYLIITTYEGVHVHPSANAIQSTNLDDSLLLDSNITTPFSRHIFQPQ